MPDAGPTLVVDVSLAAAAPGHDERVRFLDHDVRILRVGAAGDVAAAEELVRTWAAEAAAIAVTGIRDAGPAGRYDPGVAERLKRATSAVPVTAGTALGAVLDEWSIRHVETEMPGYFTNARTVVLGGADHERATRTLRHHTENIEFADPLLRLDLPARLHANPVLGLAVDAGLRPLRMLPHRLRRVPARLAAPILAPATRISTALARTAARDCHVVVGGVDELAGEDRDHVGRLPGPAGRAGPARRGHGPGHDAPAVPGRDRLGRRPRGHDAGAGGGP
jgi:hypothetical protein